ncbi:MAG: S6e family ribosomal protein [Nitrososphaerales archaeon]|jgi:small subunit ribosomal protein S6e
MAQFKLVLSDPKTGKSEVHELKDSSAQLLVGRKVGEVVDGTPMGLSGKIVIMGGSDKAGFPMRGDVQGGGKKYVLLTRGVGLKTKLEGCKKRKLVRGNIVTEEIYQVNAKMAEDAPKSA